MSNIVSGDNGTLLEFTVSDNESIVDLSSASTVEVIIKHRNNRTVKTGQITNPLSGQFEVELSSSDVQYEGVYSFQATITFLDGKKFSSNVGRITVDKKL